jgi:hypothetical protein
MSRTAKRRTIMPAAMCSLHHRRRQQVAGEARLAHISRILPAGIGTKQDSKLTRSVKCHRLACLGVPDCLHGRTGAVLAVGWRAPRRAGAGCVAADGCDSGRAEGRTHLRRGREASGRAEGHTHPRRGREARLGDGCVHSCGYPVDKQRYRGITIALLWTAERILKRFWQRLARRLPQAVEILSPPEQQATSGATPGDSARSGGPDIA